MNHCVDSGATPLTVIITRTIRAGSEQAFEDAAKALIHKALSVPGYLGVQMIRPQAGHQEYRAVVKFRTPEEWDTFQQAPDYIDFLAQTRPLLAVEPRVETECGLESWFTLRNDAMHPLPKWKTALVTMLGVYPTSMLFGLTIGQWTAEWMLPVRALVFAVSMVMLLTWIVMPLITRLLRCWLHSSSS